ncbi:hypothetical protein EDB19DRAFT_1667210 [Suillus lakei]|nr:hypothetical protein EDB19DRAFT_1667210 [Suillus lakei]
MSNTGNEQVVQEAEFDFWDFVNCSICQLPFTSSDRGPPVPFWITECGHVLCNNHLKPDQSCARCNAQNIQLVPLHRDLEPPMSDWFRPLPYSLDSIANAVKFQQDTFAGLIRYYRQACFQLNQTCERIRSERKALRKEVDSLRREVEHLRQCAPGFDPTHAQEPSSFSNANGKRPMTDVREYVKDCVYAGDLTTRLVSRQAPALGLSLPQSDQIESLCHSGSHQISRVKIMDEFPARPVNRNDLARVVLWSKNINHFPTRRFLWCISDNMRTMVNRDHACKHLSSLTNNRHLLGTCDWRPGNKVIVLCHLRPRQYPVLEVASDLQCRRIQEPQ